MKVWSEPHIYHSNPEVESEWKQSLDRASLNLVSILIKHYTTVIDSEKRTLRELQTEAAVIVRRDPTTLNEVWQSACKQATKEARELSEQLRQNREKKLLQKRRTQESAQHKTQALQYQKTDEAPIRGGTPITTLILPPIQPTTADNRDTEVETKTEQEDVENEEHLNHSLYNCMNHDFILSSNENFENETSESKKKVEHNEVVNLTKEATLSEKQLEILRKGLSFIPKPKQLDINDFLKDITRFMIHTRNTLKRHQMNWTTNKQRDPFKKKTYKPKLNEQLILHQKLHTALWRIRQELIDETQYKQNKTDNLTRKERQALNELIHNPHIIINKADKGNTVERALLRQNQPQEMGTHPNLTYPKQTQPNIAHHSQTVTPTITHKTKNTHTICSQKLNKALETLSKNVIENAQFADFKGWKLRINV